MSSNINGTRRRPLEDVRILAIEQYGAGPFGSVHLADLGAEVIKIEDPRAGGDVGRYIPPYQEGEHSLFFEAFNRNKRSIDLDITNPAGRLVFEDLVRRSDAVYSNLRGDSPTKLRIRYADLAHLNPRIVCCSLSGFGMTGPRSSQPGYDYILQGLAGWMDLTGEPGDPPEKTGLSLVDYAGGYVAVISLLAALHGARRDGIGTDCDVSLYDTAISLLNYVATWALTKGYTPTRTKHSAHPSLVPFQNFETANGWIVLACPKEKFWRRLVDVLDLDELHDISYFGSFAARHEYKDEVLAPIAARLRERTSEEWLELFESVGVPCGPVNTVAEALKDPQIEARGLVAETTHPVFGKIRQPTGAARVGPPGADLPRHRRAPLRNEDAHYILAEVLEYNTDHIDSLAIEGAFGPYDNYKATDSLNSQ